VRAGAQAAVPLQLESLGLMKITFYDVVEGIV
jgi:hypothetical protein